jgi:hypothetical protein
MHSPGGSGVSSGGICRVGELRLRRTPSGCDAGPVVLKLSVSDKSLDLHLTGATSLLARRRSLQLPRERIHRAFVLGRAFALRASPRVPCPGWSTRRSRVGVFGLRESAQLWSAGRRPVVLALYLRGEPYHRIVCEVDDPIAQAAAINRWLRAGASPPWRCAR